MTIEIEAGYRVATPLFCGGSDPVGRAELRLPSFKGVLRFWWRALAWSRCGGNLESVRQKEAELFGGVETGQSRVSMRLEAADKPRPMKVGKILKAGNQVVGQGARYLGYGVKLTSCLVPPIKFRVHMRFSGDKEQQRSLQDALICLGALGGMGARSRKGYGSLVLQGLAVNGEPCWHPPGTIEELESELKSVLANRIDSGFPPYTALSARSRHLLVTGTGPDCDSMGLLDRLGREYKSYLRSRHLHERIAFGLPRGRKRERRASPLFIHNHECSSAPVGVVSFLPARFLPEDKPEDKLYQPIDEFLKRLLTNPGEPLKAREVPL